LSQFFDNFSGIIEKVIIDKLIYIIKEERILILIRFLILISKEIITIKDLSYENNKRLKIRRRQKNRYWFHISG